MKNRLTVIRAELNLTQEELSKRAGISRTTLSSIEKDKYIPSFSTLVKLVKATGKPANEIFFDLNVVSKQHNT